MTQFEDLSPYRYGGSVEPGVIHVGWLGRGHEYSRGSVPSHLVSKMKELAEKPCELYRGYHVCDICERPRDFVGEQSSLEREKWEAGRRGRGEIRISSAGVTYAAPVLITHYIEVHGYLPPAEFLRALEEAPNNALQPTCEHARG